VLALACTSPVETFTSYAMGAPEVGTPHGRCEVLRPR